jgi:hypothetical protein
MLMSMKIPGNRSALQQAWGSWWASFLAVADFS